MTIQSLEQLKNEFLQEARSAPKLFKDLAKVEQYIAESYKTRALIELIQNADDAKSTNFGVHSIEGGFMVGNNGRVFTTADIEALCRSGSSNKQRGSNTIGYRGIGFKSVVNIANKISVFSGEYTFCFDRVKTRLLIQSDVDVPLIRIPHPVIENQEALKEQVFELKRKFKYNTVFIFQEVVKEISMDELSSLDRSSLLFLNNLRTVYVDFQNNKRSIVVEHQYEHQQTTIKIIEAENIDEWAVETNLLNSNDRIAFKKIEGTIVPALPAESVIHSFTPTYEFSGAYIKINGDFTTDPSRKIVDLDEVSKKSFNNSISILVRLMTSILNGDLTKKGFFSPFVNVQGTDSNRFKSILFKAIEVGLLKSEIKSQQGTYENFSGIRLKPEWLNYEDYESLCNNSILPITRDLISNYPELFSFLYSINVRTLNLEEILQRINLYSISILGCAQIFEKIIKQYRYDLDSSRIEKLKLLKIFPSYNNFVRADQISNADEINIEFREYLKSNTEVADIAMFFKKLGIKPEIIPEKNEIINNSKSQINTKEGPPTFNNFKFEPAIKKWRSAEQNAAEYLRSLTAVLSVTDVTQANLGYDIEVFLVSGKRVYIEIKSVAAFSEPFKITNNEYSSAHSYGPDYYIALVINEEPFMIKFVNDPIKNLSFEKKCERWSWYCEQYTTALQEVNQLHFIN